ncbi:CPBP family intramembrane glutamic endopeptidase [Staphylococcus haemolyticus]|uniref:CPBP family intramembrane glutamic endopeptidase n=1 Tax=Staphylococcus haemolyticus TaxID=1283 RepID=UPI001FB3BFE6|nr:CPBP family intramembrane glutamic endopeptidase [Staphylococcus haemolyticus]MCJ0960162.1 CPBP family intramembrane metalloprotease [Staphylococcus haemolyticus]
MKVRQFSIYKILTYMILTIAILEVAGELGGLAMNHGLAKPIGQLVSGIIFTVGTLITLKYIYSKNPDILKEIKLKGYSNKRDLIIALALPFLITFIVLVIGISTGLMQNVSVSTDIHIWAMFLFNCLFAVLYEAFPEEVLIRGLILNELRKKFKFIPSLFIQPLLFAIIGGVAHIISNLIHLGNPELLSVVGLMIQFYIFGITLQLYREFAGSLWANMLFHLVCLETVRFVFMSSSQSIIKFHETQQGVFGIIGLFFGLYIGSAIILGILLWLRKRNYQRSN